MHLAAIDGARSRRYYGPRVALFVRRPVRRQADRRRERIGQSGARSLGACTLGHRGSFSSFSAGVCGSRPDARHWRLAASQSIGSPQSSLDRRCAIAVALGADIAAKEVDMSDPTLPSFRYRLGQQPPHTGCGGLVRGASVRQFPASQGIAGASLCLQPGSLRELHWHTNAAELGYVVSGSCRTTVLSPIRSGLATFGISLAAGVIPYWGPGQANVISF
jgi:hypothetical protein